MTSSLERARRALRRELETNVKDAISAQSKFNEAEFKKRFHTDEQRLAKSFLNIASRLLADEKGASLDWCAKMTEDITTWLASMESGGRQVRKRCFGCCLRC